MIKHIKSLFPWIEKRFFKISVIGLTTFFFIVTSIVFAWYSYLDYSIISSYKKQLSTMAAQRMHDIDIFLNEQENNAIKLSKKTPIVTALNDLYIKKEAPAAQTETLGEFIRPYKEQMKFKNILLIGIDGTILFATAKNTIIGENIYKNNHARSSLSTSCERASMAFTNDFSYFSYDQLLQEPALFITIPLLKDNKFIGTLAYQLDQEKIYLITNQYIGLGKTGEVVLGKQEDSAVIFVAASRHDPDLAFKKISLQGKTPLSIEAGLLTQENKGTATDYRGEPVVLASAFIPKIDWGMVIKIDQKEILQPLITSYNLLLIFCVIFLLLLLLSLYCSRSLVIKIWHTSNLSKQFKTIPSILKNPFLILFFIFLSLTIKNIVQEKNLQSSIIESARTQAQKDVSKNAADIETILNKIAFVGQSIAKDLQSGHLVHDDIPTRLKRDSKENSTIMGITILFMPYTYDKILQLYAPSIKKINNDSYEEKTLSEASLDGDKETSIFNSLWYTKALEQGSAWLLNAIPENSSQKETTASYSCTFFDKDNNPQGVVLITYSLTDIIHIAEYSDFGQTGYSIILSDNGTFIFHPTSSMAQKQITLLQFAQSEGNEELAVIAEKVLKGNPVIESYSSAASQGLFTLCSQPIALNNWIVGALFPEDEITVPAQVIRHYYFWILICALLALLTLCGFLYSWGLLSKVPALVLCYTLLIMSLISAWYIIKITTTINRESKTVIIDQPSLNKFLNDLDEEASRKHEDPPIQIPFGLYLYSFDIANTDHIDISGYIWGKYNTIKHKNLSRTIDMPQATKIQFGAALTSIHGDWETVTQNVQGTLFQNQDYEKFPFDQQHLRIVFEHRNIEKNIILTPDLTGYKTTVPEETPGLNKEFYLSGFDVEQTFFEYHKKEPTTNFGFKEYGKVTDNYQLIYNVVMNRNLLNSFVLFLLPLLVILFSLFCTLLMTGRKTNPFAVLAPYTGLFFALVILQRALREQHPTASTLYMEYAFFYTYVTIILLIVHTILTHYYKDWQYYQEQALHMIKLCFWPFQLTMWLITTLIIFY